MNMDSTESELLNKFVVRHFDATTNGKMQTEPSVENVKLPLPGTNDSVNSFGLKRFTVSHFEKLNSNLNSKSPSNYENRNKAHKHLITNTINAIFERVKEKMDSPQPAHDRFAARSVDAKSPRNSKLSPANDDSFPSSISKTPLFEFLGGIDLHTGKCENEPTETSTEPPNELEILGVVIRQIGDFACIYTADLSISHFFVYRNSLIGPDVLGKWFRLRLAAGGEAPNNAISGAHFAHVNEARESAALSSPPLRTRLSTDCASVELFVELFVGARSSHDGFRICYSRALPPLFDVDGALARQCVGQRVLAWCTLRHAPYRNCYWRIVQLANGYANAGNIYNIDPDSIPWDLKLPMGAPSRKRIKSTRKVPEKLPIFSDRLAPKTESVKPIAVKSVRPAIRSSQSDIPSTSKSVPNRRNDEEYVGVVCAYLDDDAASDNAATPALGNVDYLVQAPARQILAFLSRDVACHCRVDAPSASSSSASAGARPAEYGQEKSYENLLGQWILFHAESTNGILDIYEYKIIPPHFNTMPTFSNVMISCTLDVPSDFSANRDVLFADQLGVTIFDTKSLIRPAHYGRRELPVIIACEAHVSKADALIWHVENVRDMPKSIGGGKKNLFVQ